MYLGRTTSPLTLYWQPKLSYTYDSRTPKFEGTVTINVMFLANGSVGKIEFNKNLPPPLEQAINRLHPKDHLPPQTRERTTNGF
jgi:hypothetical protein